MEINDFKKFCLNSDPEITVQKYLIDGPSYYFDKIQLGQEFEFKKEIARILNVHIRDIVIVGSGKLGFSIKPAFPGSGLFLFKKFDHDYELGIKPKKSDLDIAIVSSQLFDKEIENLYTHTTWYQNFKWDEKSDFAKYILKGRFIIRFLPGDFKLSKEVEIVQSSYQEKYGREINLEIYKSWYFFETYHNNNVFNIKLNLLR